jgi:hypothetical protein
VISKDYRLLSKTISNADSISNLEANPSKTTYSKIGTSLHSEHFLSKKLSIVNSIGVDYSSGRIRSTTFEVMNASLGYYDYRPSRHRLGYQIYSYLTYRLF